jgi:membrane associated rhomboid family serine protease
MEKEEDAKEVGTRASRYSARDGLIDFKNYSIGQLLELETSIDPQAFPENHRNLVAALASKQSSQPTLTPTDDSVPGRFSSRDGLLAWIGAKFVHSPLYGQGSIHVGPTETILSGWQRTWLGVPIETQMTFGLEQVRNVVEDGGVLRFQITRKYLPALHIAFTPHALDSMQGLLSKLPQTQSDKFLENWAALRDFNSKLRSISQRPIITPIVVALNIAVFLAMCVTGKSVGQFASQQLMAWGANFGPWTVHGQWWRLFTALFIHLNVAHVGLNMWALWNIGRLSERLFGRATLLFLYICTGLLASLTSIAWNPSVTSVGASGAIFGLFGTFLAFLLRRRREIPASVIRRHWISTTLFVLFNLVSGATQPGIDNAAHVGGLISGLVLGFLLARPLDRAIRASRSIAPSLSAVAFTAAAFALGVWQVNGIGSNLTIPEEYFRKHVDYANGEAENMRLWASLAQSSVQGTLSDADFAARFEKDILPFWEKQKDLLKKDSETLKGPQGQYAQLIAQFAELHYEWSNALIEAAKTRDQERAAESVRLMGKATLLNARLERIALRSQMDHRPRALANAPLVTTVRRLLTGKSTVCVKQPSWYGRAAADTDNQADGPAMRQALGCRAQQLFLAGDYKLLEELMNRTVGRMEDMPDGTSSYAGIVTGLSNLFTFGGLSTEVVFGHTADWRRAIGHSVMADLVEAMAFTEWAWSARGNGYANSVSSQNMAAYAYRTEMAAAALEEIADRAATNPLWYTLSLDVGRDHGLEKEKLRDIFEEGEPQFRRYLPLYSRMLRILMPRWGGSFEDVDAFIDQVYSKSVTARGYERYAELYTTYARFEGDEIDFFRETRAFWSGIRVGYLGLLKRYPKSDAVLNDFAYMACRADDGVTYNQLRRAIGKRLSSSAWTPKYSIEACDKKLASAVEFSDVAPLDLGKDNQIRSLGIFRLGMTPRGVSATKVKPIRQEPDYWVYNSLDSTHNGVLTVVFSLPTQDTDSDVQAIAYSGDERSSPLELPYLDGLSVADVIEKFGQPIKGRFTAHGEMTYKFSNGVYINTLDEQVYRYGIAIVPGPDKFTHIAN